MHSKTRAYLTTVLLKNERIIWQSQPTPSRYARRKRADVWIGLVGFGFSFMLLLPAIRLLLSGANITPTDTLPLLAYLPLLFLFFYMATAGHRAHREARKTGYAITNRRIMIVQPYYRSFRVKSYRKEQIEDLDHRNMRDDFGDLIFAVDFRPSGRYFYQEEIGFFGIENVSKVQKLILAGMGYRTAASWG